VCLLVQNTRLFEAALAKRCVLTFERLLVGFIAFFTNEIRLEHPVPHVWMYRHQYIYIYIFMCHAYIYYIHIYVCIYVSQIHILCTYIHTYMYTCMFIFVHIHTDSVAFFTNEIRLEHPVLFVFIYINIYLHTYAHTTKYSRIHI